MLGQVILLDKSDHFEILGFGAPRGLGMPSTKFRSPSEMGTAVHSIHATWPVEFEPTAVMRNNGCWQGMWQGPFGCRTEAETEAAAAAVGTVPGTATALSHADAARQA